MGSRSSTLRRFAFPGLDSRHAHIKQVAEDVAGAAKELIQEGKLKHFGLSRFSPEARKANQALVDVLGKIAKRKSATPAQIALGWLLAQKPWIVPIPWYSGLERLEENNGAAEVKLTSDDLRGIESGCSEIQVQGARLPEMRMELIDR